MKKFWQSIKIWQKALVLFFVVLFIIFHAVFLCSVNFLAQDALMCKNTNMSKGINIFKMEKAIKDKELEINTTKKEYAKGEEIKVILKNNLDEEIFLYGISATTQLIDYYGENGNREIADIADVDVRLDINCECFKECRYVTKIMPKEQKEFVWDQKNDSGDQAEEGVYKLSATLGAWDKSVLIYSDAFTILSDQEFSECQKDDDCEAEFSNCDCKYHCLNKNNEEEEFEDCDNECRMILPPKPECVCSNNKCVEASNCDKLKSEINDLIDKIKYCEKDSDCELDESYDDTIWPFDCFLIKNKLYGEDYRNLIQEKTNEYLDNDCPYYPLRECPYPSKSEDIGCKKNECVDLRFYNEDQTTQNNQILEK